MSRKTIEKIQLASNLFTSVGVIIALLVLILEIRKNSELKQFETFTKMLDQYDVIVTKRKECFNKIKVSIRDNPKLKHEMPDGQNSLSYLMIRLNQAEPFFAVEHELLGLEIKCLCYLNELCDMAISNKRAEQIIKLKESNEITYYNERLRDLLTLYESQRKLIHFHKPKYDKLSKLNVSDYFDQTYQ